MNLGYKHLKGGFKEYKRRPETSRIKAMKSWLGTAVPDFCMHWTVRWSTPDSLVRRKHLQQKTQNPV